MGPLSGLRVLDLTWALAGPFATMVLADLGAEVIKVERPGDGDHGRRTGPFLDGASAYFASLNRGKKSLTLNLKLPRGRDLLLRLAEHVDVLVENFRPRVMAGLGLDYPTLAGCNPRLIYASCSGFGQHGPYADRAAVDTVIQAMAGTCSITGEPGRPPLRVGFSIGDLGGSVFTLIGVLAALHERERSGRGQWLDVAMLDSQVALLENAYLRYFATGETAGPLGSRHPALAPFQLFEARDGYLAVCAYTEEQWPAFCRLIGRQELLGDPRFVTHELRTRHHATLEPVLAEALRTGTVREWEARLTAAGIPAGPVNRVDQMAADPHMPARELLAEVEVAGRRLTVVGSPLKFSRTPARVGARVPALGEHTEGLLRELLGLSPDEIAMLRRDGVV